MSLVNAKCTNCGANLTVDEAKDAAICQYCGSAFIVEKAINNYKVVNNIKAKVVKVYGTKNDFDIRGGVLVKYNGSSVNPIIPNGVVKINYDVFQNTMIESIIIPNTVVEIGQNAFRQCVNLKKVVLPNSLTLIITEAFRGCKSIEKIEIPDSVKELEYGIFNDCSNLKEVKISDYLINKYGNYTEFGWSGSGDLFECFFNYTKIDRINGELAEKVKKIKDIKRLEYERKASKQKEERRKNNLCQHCGGKFEGIFTKKCKACGKPKDY